MIMKNCIEVKNLKFKYDKTQDNYILNDVSFHVKQGEWVSIVGHNGSGKSTIVRLIDGLLAAESGSIIVEGQELTEESVWEIRHKIAMVFQNPDNQFVGSTVEDDIAFGLENKGLPVSEMKERISEVLGLVGMTELAKREPARLSGGQKQRVAIASAIAMRPNIIILDEATSMLDPEGRLQLIQTINKIKRNYNLTVISITHDLDEIAMSDRVLVMKSGCLQLDVTPKELFAASEKLDDLGLDIPFSTKLIENLKEDYSFSSNYLEMKELEDELWELLSKM